MCKTAWYIVLMFGSCTRIHLHLTYSANNTTFYYYVRKDIKSLFYLLTGILQTYSYTSQ